MVLWTYGFKGNNLTTGNNPPPLILFLWSNLKMIEMGRMSNVSSRIKLTYNLTQSYKGNNLITGNDQPLGWAGSSVAWLVA